MEEQIRESVRRLLERAKAEWDGMEFVIHVHPAHVRSLVDPAEEPVPNISELTFMGSELHAWEVDMPNPPPANEVHISPFYGRRLPARVPQYTMTIPEWT